MNLWKPRKPGKLGKFPDRTPLSSSPIERKTMMLLGKYKNTIATGESMNRWKLRKPGKASRSAPFIIESHREENGAFIRKTPEYNSYRSIPP